MSGLLEGKTALVTGASSGIGLATARGLLERGARVALVGRDPVRTEDAAAELRASHADRLHAFRADFASLAEVRGLAEAVRAELPRLDILVHNAGVWLQKRQASADGFEATFAINYLAPFLLTHALLPAMRHGDEARIVHVSSRVHDSAGLGPLAQLGRWGQLLGTRRLRARLDLQDLSMQRYRSLEAYARSKLAQVVFSNELARHLGDTSITSNALHPGDVNTRVVRDSTLLSVGIRVAAPLLRTPEEGAATTIHVASAPSLRGVTGRYFADEAEATPAPIVHDRALGERLWELSLRMSGAEDATRAMLEPAA